MTTLDWSTLSARDLQVFRATLAYLAGRLEEQGTLEWALGLGLARRAEKVAVVEALNARSGRILKEPWQSAWRLIEESWEFEQRSTSDGTDKYAVRERIRRADLSGATAAAIVRLVRPRVRVGTLTRWERSEGESERRPKVVRDLMTVQLTSGPVVDPATIDINGIGDVAFLIELAVELDAAISKGLAIGIRIGWTGGHDYWRIGDLSRVYFVPSVDPPEATRDPDSFHKGIAPVVKLASAVVSRIAEIDASKARPFCSRWRIGETPIHTRLWAAMAREPSLCSSTDVGSFLEDCEPPAFWDPRKFPEVAELRALRFTSLDAGSRRRVLRRIRKGPPRSFWRGVTAAGKVDEYRAYWSVREFRRIQNAGGAIETPYAEWVAAQLPRFDDLRINARIDADFPEAARASSVPPDPDSRFDFVSGVERLKEIEQAIATGRRGWDDDPARRADDWLRLPGNAEAVLGDLEAAPDSGSEFPKVWERFGWIHRPSSGQEDPQTAEEDNRKSTNRVLALLLRLPEGTASSAIGGISAWLETWDDSIGDQAVLAEIWMQLWPLAAAATNVQQPIDAEPDLNVIVHGADDQEPEDLDTLNTPAGRLVGVFLSACPEVKAGEQPFVRDDRLRVMRDLAMATDRRSGLIVRYRFTEALPWFLVADPDWCREQLIAPLNADSDQATVLWRAVASRMQSQQAIEALGLAMIARATDQRLGRDTRKSLVWNIVLEPLHAFNSQRNVVVPVEQITQMLRSVDDEVRAHAAQVIQRFVSEMSAPKEESPDPPPTREDLFRRSADRFLRTVWPQERSLVSPGVASALADLPATSGEAFAEAVSVVERFLMPFDCWALHAYGFRGEDNPDLLDRLIGDAEKAKALLRLLDKTIGVAEGATVPHDLGRAMERIRLLAPRIVETNEFRRLTALTRR